MKRRMADAVMETNWRQLYVERTRIDSQVRHAIDGIVACSRERIPKFDAIIAHMYDAKDEILRHCNADDSVEDVLARRYWSQKILACIHRRKAVTEWESLRMGASVPLERALGSFDMFVLGPRRGDNDEIADTVRTLAARIRKEHDEFDDLSTRQKALFVVATLRMYGFTGVKADHMYGALQTNFIGVALQDEEHQTLPLISVGIFCAVASRLGLDAHPCGYPWHVYGIVNAPDGLTLDGRPAPEGADRDRIYVDPFRSSSEVELSELRSTLTSLGAAPPSHHTYLNEAPTREIVLRTARNIVNSVDRIQLDRRARTNDPDATVFVPDVDDAYYASLWAMMLIGASADENALTLAMRLRHYFGFITEHFEIHFPWDVKLLEDYMAPLFASQPAQRRELGEICMRVRASDMQRKTPVRRGTSASETVSFKVGQMFQHKRYGYEGVISGWDPSCEAGEMWIQQMGVDRLSKGRQQSFYHVL